MIAGIGHRGIGMTSQRTRERLVERLRQRGIRDPRVLEAIRGTPRHIFVDEALASRAYEDTALPIGHGQTISQPFIVALMTQTLLEKQPLNNVLEIGTGSGYQTAILAQLVKRVYTVERIEALLKLARMRLRALKLKNAHPRHCDGGMGLPQYAPYDGIIVTAAPEYIPSALIEQLAVGGHLILPFGPRNRQQLVRVIRTKKGYETERLESVSFVPLLGGTQ